MTGIPLLNHLLRDPIPESSYVRATDGLSFPQPSEVHSLKAFGPPQDAHHLHIGTDDHRRAFASKISALRMKAGATRPPPFSSPTEELSGIK